MNTNKQSFRILVIDDNKAIHQDFIKILMLANPELQALDALDERLFEEKKTSEVPIPEFHIDTASQGQEGVEYIKKALAENDPYVIAFVDVRMPPGWDGVETVKHIWALDRDIQIVICTAFSDYSWEETVAQLGLNDNMLILKKPFDSVAVRQIACALAKKWQLLHEAKNYTAALELGIQERTHSLNKSLTLTRATLESSTDGILVVDEAGKTIDQNGRFLSMFSVPKSVMDTQNETIIFEYLLKHVRKSEAFSQCVYECLKDPEKSTSRTFKHIDGRVFECFYQPHQLEGAIVGRIWSFRDISERFYLEKKLEYQATHDALTDLPNRVLLHDRIRQAISSAKRNGCMAGLLFVDLDRFKLINDSLSHQTGDEILQAIAKRISSIIRADDTLIRLGGDEFVLIAQNLTHRDDATYFASKILSILKTPFKLNEREITISASIGISLYPVDGTSGDELLRNADLAMYAAKSLGGNTIQFYTEEMNKKVFKSFEMEAELHRALKNHEFFLCYQPEIDSITKKIMSVEALIRWQHPEKGIIPPLEFIPVAETNGLIVPIGEWVLRTACEQNKRWQMQGLSPVRVAVNVSDNQFKQTDFPTLVKKILEQTKLNPSYLEIEIAENVLLNNFNVIQVIIELKKIGVQVSLDDFGTGNSSLSYLTKLPLDRLKIDQSFLKNIKNNQTDQAIVRAILEIANSMHLKVVAEGVETQHQIEFLENNQCAGMQGYYFSKPLLATDMEALLRRGIRAT